MAFLIVAAAILCGLLSNIRLHYCLTVERERAMLSVQVQAFFRLVRFRIQGCVSYFPLRLYAGGKIRDLDKKRGRKKSLFFREFILQHDIWLRADELRIRGVVGNAEDACAAICWAGATSITLDCLARFLLTPVSLQVRVVPVCGVRCFCLNLEGIVTLRIWQIIGVAIRHQIRGTRGKKLWHTPLKTS
ncbi:MAG: hypothetical protein VB049_04670 [Candidatus Pelethousia sp.]|nr:hypothetical protein [Candidatus Pelethousia sp.]